MNKISQCRYAKGKGVRVIGSETGECESVGIGWTGSARNGTLGLRLSFVAPDGRETVLAVNDDDTLARLAEMIAKVQRERKGSEEYNAHRAAQLAEHESGN